MNRTYLILIFLFTISACSSPFPGGKLSGTITPIQQDWLGVTEAEVIQIETNPTDPYSVHLWVTVMDGAPYIHAGANRATWVEHIETDPLVVLGHEEKLYELVAQRVTSPEEFTRLSEIYKTKYGNYPRNPDIKEVYLYRLEPR